MNKPYNNDRYKGSEKERNNSFNYDYRDENFRQIQNDNYNNYNNRNDERRYNNRNYRRDGRNFHVLTEEERQMRIEERDNNPLSIWPTSPEIDNYGYESESESEIEAKKRLKRRSRDSDSDSDSEFDSESDSDSDSYSDSYKKKKHSKSRKKHKKNHHHKKHRHKKSKHSKHKKSRNHKKRRTSDSESESSIESESESERKSESESHHHHHQSEQHSIEEKEKEKNNEEKEEKKESNDVDVQDYWAEKKVQIKEDNGDIGPMPLPVHPEAQDERSYGGALLAGEGSAMAAYIKSGKRIPRRGEIGLDSEEIEKFESVGYVMSGSRHRRMNAVRIRKENQVISAEEKRALMIFNQEEKMKRENKIIAEFKTLVDEKIKPKYETMNE
jgi:hypothetical protein